MKHYTQFVVEIAHDKPLPSDLAALLENRVYALLMNAGITVDVAAVEVDLVKVKEMAK